mmetsp:Transcript_20676/g.57704  ORF Transcript_20676/g.57704 Transcript_20676/m.57704 type:complete len:294 (+) Transcript_20676:1203-2084(+)
MGPLAAIFACTIMRLVRMEGWPGLSNAFVLARSSTSFGKVRNRHAYSTMRDTARISRWTTIETGWWPSTVLGWLAPNAKRPDELCFTTSTGILVTVLATSKARELEAACATLGGGAAATAADHADGGRVVWPFLRAGAFPVVADAAALVPSPSSRSGTTIRLATTASMDSSTRSAVLWSGSRTTHDLWSWPLKSSSLSQRSLSISSTNASESVAFLITCTCNWSTMLRTPRRAKLKAALAMGPRCSTDMSSRTTWPRGLSGGLHPDVGMEPGMLLEPAFRSAAGAALVQRRLG